MTDLLPCPFCGSNNLRHEFSGSQGYIECNECGTQGPCDELAADPICDDEAAFNAWNRRTALAQPEPQGPTECELVRAIPDWWPCTDAPRYDLDDSNPEQPLFSVFQDDVVEYARAVLTRWGRPAIEPVPVAERLPGPGDCDAEGECWRWHPDHKEDEFSDGWMLLKHKWADGRHDRDDSPIYTHWLPHHALPVPQP